MKVERLMRLLSKMDQQALPAWRKRLAGGEAAYGPLAEQLDTLVELLPLPDTGDKYCDFADWLGEGERAGLLTWREHNTLRQYLARYWLA